MFLSKSGAEFSEATELIYGDRAESMALHSSITPPVDTNKPYNEGQKVHIELCIE